MTTASATSAASSCGIDHDPVDISDDEVSRPDVDAADPRLDVDARDDRAGKGVEGGEAAGEGREAERL